MTKRGEAISQTSAPFRTPSTHIATMTLEPSCLWPVDLSALGYTETMLGSGASFLHSLAVPVTIPTCHHCSSLFVSIHLSISVFTGLRSVNMLLFRFFFKCSILVKFCLPLFFSFMSYLSWLLVSFQCVTKQSL